MISGTLPDARRRQMTFGVIAMALMMALVAVFVIGPLVRQMPMQRTMVPMALMMVLLIAVAVSNILQIRRRLITHFDYDGSTLYFQTLGRPEPQTRQMIELHKVTDWRSKGGLFGYILVFRDGSKLNVDLTMTNARELMEKIERNRWPSASD